MPVSEHQDVRARHGIAFRAARLCDLSELCGVVDNFAIGQRLLKLLDFGPGEVGIVVYYKPFQAL